MCFEALKKALDDYDTKASSTYLTEIFNREPENFRKGLLLSNCLPEPLERDFNDKKLETLITAFILAGKDLLEKEDVDIVKYSKEFIQVSQTIRIINKNSKSNLKRLMDNKFSQYTLPEQLQMFCIFLEDQHRLSQIEIQKHKKGSKYITGMESEVAVFPAKDLNGIKISATDNFEFLIEIADTLFRFLYYKAKNSIEANENFNYENISPYNIGSFEEILRLAEQRNLLVNLWGKFKYRDWKLSVHSQEDQEIYCFAPKLKENLKLEHIAVNRYIYRDHINSQKRNAKYIVENRKSAQYLFNLSKKIDILNISSLFTIRQDDFLKANIFIRNLVLAYRESIDDVYLSAKFNCLEMSSVFLGFEYLFTIAMIYQDAVLEGFNQDNISHYQRLSPIVDRNMFIKHFADIYDLSVEHAEKIIDLFIFYPIPRLDVFSQPLIYAGKGKVVLCPTLILQMNLSRIVEMYLTEWDVNISHKGTEFEKTLRTILSLNPHIKVNTNKIEFKAFDGRDVEFDFIGTFNDYILLVEFKHLKIPFSDKTKKNCEDVIEFGAEQVNRRVEVLKNDWDEVKKRCNIPLPEKPVDESKIIKLVCTNIFDFTAIIINGVRITDSSSMLKFFTTPYVHAISVGEKVEKLSTQRLWKNENPTVEEFNEFLAKPVAVKPLLDCFDAVWKPITKVEEDDFNISFFDYSMVKNPYETIVDDGLRNEEIKTVIKVGRNDPCPCKSGKKYKKCCGK